MNDVVAPEIIKYLDEAGLKQTYARLNRRYKIVDELPADISAMTPYDRNAIYVVKEEYEDGTSFFPYIIDDGKWVSLGISPEEIDGKADLVEGGVKGHAAVLDEYGNISDAGMYPGVFIALTSDRNMNGKATNLMHIWSAYLSGMPVLLLDNAGNGLYAALNAAGYLWVERGYVREEQCTLGDNNRPVDDTTHGYIRRLSGKIHFYSDPECMKEIAGVEGKFYLDCVGNKVYRFFDEVFVKVQRFIQFSTLELDKASDPVWEDREVSSMVYYRMVEPLGSWSPDSFSVAKITASGGGGGGDIRCKADKVVNAVDGHLAGLSGDGNLTDSGLDPEDLATREDLDKKCDTDYVNLQLAKKADKGYVDLELAKKIDKGYAVERIATPDGVLPMVDGLVTIPKALSNTPGVYGKSGLVSMRYDEFNNSGMIERP